MTVSPCRKCGGPREGLTHRGDGRQFWFCVPCRKKYMAAYHAKRREQAKAQGNAARLRRERSG